MNADPRGAECSDRSASAIDAAVEKWRASGARILSLMHTGADGWLKTLDFAPHDDDHLRMILEVGERADGSSLFRGCGLTAESSDILIRPCAQTAFIDPFAPTQTLAVLCGHVGRDNEPLAQAPDTIVRRAASRVCSETGHELWAHGEVEFFLGRRANTEHESRGADDRGYHAASPYVFGEALRRRALVLLADMGVPVKYGHSEVGCIEPQEPGGLIWEQHEIEIALRPIAEAANAIVLTQWVLRNLAHEAGFRLSMDPVVIAGHPGNGLHVHMSPWANGAPVEFGRRRNELPPAAQWLIGGLVRLGGALMAFGNRSPHSLTRLRQGLEVPRHVMWGAFDRSALVRIPVVPLDEDGSPAITPTIEFRLPDGSAHPHLTLAGIAQAMVFGHGMQDLDHLLARTEAGIESNGTNGAALPFTIAEIGEALVQHREAFEAGGVFPSTFIDETISALCESAT